MFTRPNPASGVPIYRQVVQQVRHAVELGALQPGDQLPGIRVLAQSLVINANTIAKAYRELEHEGVIELRHGSGAFVAASGLAEAAAVIPEVQPRVRGWVEELVAEGLGEAEIRRLFEGELARLYSRPGVLPELAEDR